MGSAPGETGMHKRCGYEDENNEVGSRAHCILNIGVIPPTITSDPPKVLALNQRIEPHDTQETEICRQHRSDQ